MIFLSQRIKVCGNKRQQSWKSIMAKNIRMHPKFLVTSSFFNDIICLLHVYNIQCYRCFLWTKMPLANIGMHPKLLVTWCGQHIDYMTNIARMQLSLTTWQLFINKVTNNTWHGDENKINMYQYPPSYAFTQHFNALDRLSKQGFIAILREINCFNPYKRPFWNSQFLSALKCTIEISI